MLRTVLFIGRYHVFVHEEGENSRTTLNRIGRPASGRPSHLWLRLEPDWLCSPGSFLRASASPV
jgi:hypothetical protein